MTTQHYLVAIQPWVLPTYFTCTIVFHLTLILYLDTWMSTSFSLFICFNYVNINLMPSLVQYCCSIPWLGLAVSIHLKNLPHLILQSTKIKKSPRTIKINMHDTVNLLHLDNIPGYLSALVFNKISDTKESHLYQFVCLYFSSCHMLALIRCKDYSNLWMHILCMAVLFNQFNTSNP